MSPCLSNKRIKEAYYNTSVVPHFPHISAHDRELSDKLDADSERRCILYKAVAAIHVTVPVIRTWFRYGLMEWSTMDSAIPGKRRNEICLIGSGVCLRSDEF